MYPVSQTGVRQVHQRLSSEPRRGGRCRSTTSVDVSYEKAGQNKATAIDNFRSSPLTVNVARAEQLVDLTSLTDVAN